MPSARIATMVASALSPTAHPDPGERQVVVAGKFDERRAGNLRREVSAFLHLETTVAGPVQHECGHADRRQNLAAVLVKAGRADEAETVLWEELKRNPEHVWTLSLLARALRAGQGRRCCGRGGTATRVLEALIVFRVVTIA